MLGFATTERVVPPDQPDLDSVNVSPDTPPVIRTAEGLRQLQEMLVRPPRDMPKLARLLQQPSPFTDE